MSLSGRFYNAARVWSDRELYDAYPETYGEFVSVNNYPDGLFPEPEEYGMYAHKRGGKIVKITRRVFR